MPIYEYRCDSCGFQKEHIQKMSDEPLTVCPSCAQPSYKKMLSAAGFQLKGSGWYATDFKGNNAPAAKQQDSGATDSAAPTSGGCCGGCACHSS